MKTWSSLAVVAALMLTSCLAAARAGALRSVPEHSRLEFTAQYETEQLPGRFESFRVEAGRNATSGAPDHLRVTVDMASVDMNDRDINAELKNPDWFDATRFPVAVFKARRIEASGDGTFIAHGDLTLKGLAMALAVPFDWTEADDGYFLDGEVAMSRQSWNVGLGEWARDDTIADNVVVRFRVKLR